MFISFEGIDGCGKSTQARLLADLLRARGQTVVLTREPGGSEGAERIRALLVQGDPDAWSPATEALLFTAARRDHLERVILPACRRGDWVVTDRFADSTRVYQGARRAGAQPDRAPSLNDTAPHKAVPHEPAAAVAAIDGWPVQPSPAYAVPALGTVQPAPRPELAATRLDGGAPDARDALAPGLLLSGADLDGEGGRNPDSDWDRDGAALDRLHALMIGVQPDLTFVIDVDPAQARDRSTARGGAEDRFERIGLVFQTRLAHGFRDLARRYPARVRLIDGSGTPSEVAARVAACLPAHPPE